MDIVLGVSMAPTTVRMVLVEGENADGVTVDEDGFEVPADADTANTDVADQVIAAILGTRESAAEGDYHLASTGVTWTSPAEAAALRDALAAHKVENVMLVSAFLAAAALAQAVGSAVGYAHTGLLFLEPDTATLAIVDSADGSVTDVRRRPLADADAPTELADMMAGLESLQSRPDGVFVVGCGVDVTAIKPQLETATALPVNAPEEPETALARGAALAAANAPLFASSTAAVAYAQVPDWTTAEVVDSGAAADFSDLGDPYSVDNETGSGRKPFLVALSVMMVFFVGVLALVISLAVAVRPAVSQRPSSGGNLVVPAERMPAPAPKAEVPAPPAAPPNKVEQPVPEVQQAPREAPAPEAPAPAAPAPVAPAPVQVPAAAAPAPEAPAPAPQAPPAPAPAPAPPPAAPAPVPVPIPVPVAPVVPQLPSIFNPPGNNLPFQPGGGDRDRGGWQPGGGDRDRGGWQPGGGDRDRGGWQPGGGNRGGGGWQPGGGDRGGGGWFPGGGDHGGGRGGGGGFGGIGGGFGGFGGGHGGFGGRGH
ncbi:hypothetical protein MFM001_25860 [Mycobacterium sp. MFM001]|uniref:DUF7159 family protein n=1 Tax=Mycobacterium sp. MFM001 TaxID=2049453 RepID=UPI000DA57B0C|nr:hypothetical protein [Mycobacterium sp. MFM001]GBE66124.1 hypothetical protein MFM001_25860 [Mycobacterium sp. MFM001]